MGNERLRSRLHHAGMTTDELATHLQVDPKTVDRWLDNGRLPHLRHRVKTAQLLQAEQTFLWPELLETRRSNETSKAELLTMYPHRGAVPADLWRKLIDDAKEHLDVLVYAGLFLLDGHPDLPARLVKRAADGLKVRLLYGDPASEAVRTKGEEEGIGSNLAARVELSLTYLEPVMGAPGIEVRLHDTPLYNSIYRFDDQMLVNTHAYGFGAPHNPVLHLQQLPDGQVFGRYVESFDRVWSQAQEAAAAPSSRA
jgi:transcriptional regulator with XRE-family HTH domain